MKKRTRKDTLGPQALADLLRPIMLEAPEWAAAVRELMHGRREPFDALVARGTVPMSVAPVIARLAAGKSMKLDGRRRVRPFEVEANAWRIVMAQRHLGARDPEAEATAAAETGLTTGQVAGVIEDYVRAGLTLDVWRSLQSADTLAAIEALRRH